MPKGRLSVLQTRWISNSYAVYEGTRALEGRVRVQSQQWTAPGLVKEQLVDSGRSLGGHCAVDLDRVVGDVDRA